MLSLDLVENCLFLSRLTFEMLRSFLGVLEIDDLEDDLAEKTMIN